MDGRPLQPPTETLLLHAASGDSRAREALYERFLPVLRRWAQGRLPAAARELLDTDDLVQDAVLGSLRNLQGIRNERQGGFLGYLKISVQNRIRDELRRKGNQRDHSHVVDQIPDDAPSPLHRLMLDHDLERYERALAELGVADRELVVARLEFHMEYAEIAIHMGKPSADAARMATKRAVERLVRRLADVDRS